MSERTSRQTMLIDPVYSSKLVSYDFFSHSSSASVTTAIRDWRLASSETRLRPEVIYRVSAADANGIADAFVRDWTKYFVGSNDHPVDYILVEEGGENERKHKDFVRKVGSVGGIIFLAGIAGDWCPSPVDRDV